MSRDEELCEVLDAAGVTWVRLDEPSRREVEIAWRKIYGAAFIGHPRLRQGTKAQYAYDQLQCDRYFVVPLTSKVDGLPVTVRIRSVKGYECSGPLVPLGKFHDVEFFVCPTNFAWTMVHTHEDHGYGGPFFIQQNWLAGELPHGREVS
jgi:hypothetical protein